VTPPGVTGGGNGGPNRLVLNMGSEKENSLGMFATNVPLRKGDTVDFISNGGGGYGDSLEREPEKVLEEVIDGFLTIEGAREAYGVVVEAVDPDVHDFRIDAEATAALRKEMALVERPEGYGPGEIHPDGKRTGELLRAHAGHSH